MMTRRWELIYQQRRHLYDPLLGDSLHIDASSSFGAKRTRLSLMTQYGAAVAKL